jgi:hypothetical protein
MPEINQRNTMKLHSKTPNARCVLPTLLLALTVAAAHAGPRTSANYSIITDTNDSGGQLATSAAYTNNGSAGAGGLSTGATPVEFARSGYAGQLYDVTSLSVAGPGNPATVDGGATLPLAASASLDDGSSLALASGSVTWSVLNGPITGISSAGLARAGAVSQNTAATVQGVYAGYTGSLGLTVDVPSADFTSGTQTPIISDGYIATGSSIILGLGYAPTSGTVLTVVDNTGTTAIQGTFNNLAQGQIVNLSYGGQTYSFLANYNGGSNGLSLVLQFVSQVPTLPRWATLALGVFLMALGARAASRKTGKAGRTAA